MRNVADFGLDYAMEVALHGKVGWGWFKRLTGGIDEEESGQVSPIPRVFGQCSKRRSWV